MDGAGHDGPVTADAASDPWDAVPGQDRAVALLRAAAAEPLHAYLFVGPPGSGKDRAAAVFAGEILAAGTDDPAAARRWLRPKRR